MATNTSLIVRQPPPAPMTSSIKRRGGRGKPRVSGRQIGVGLAGAMASAAVSAGLISWLGVRPQWAGMATGSLGAIGAVLSDGPDMRPFAAGAAFGGTSLAVASVLLDFEQKHKSDQKNDRKADAQLDKPTVVASAPTNAKNGNATASAPVADGFRRASSVSDEMRSQIAHAMHETRYRPQHG